MSRGSGRGRGRGQPSNNNLPAPGGMLLRNEDEFVSYNIYIKKSLVLLNI